MHGFNANADLWYMPAAEQKSAEQDRKGTVFAVRSPLPSTPSAEPLSDHPQGPICCWNICIIAFAPKKPRPSSLASVDLSSGHPARMPAEAGASHRSASLALPSMPSQATDPVAVLLAEPPLTGGLAPNGAAATAPVARNRRQPTPPKQSQHVIQRLLVETISPDHHFVFNPLSGAVDLLADVEMGYLEKLQRGDPVMLPPALERTLRARRYLLDDPTQEEQCLEAAVASAWTRMQALQPEAYTVCPTLACNLACAYCFEGDSLLDKQQGVMTENQVEQLFAGITQLRRDAAGRGQTSPSPPWIALFGGEPLLPSTKACVGHILRLAAAGGFLVGATTNGVNVTRFEDLLREYHDILTTFQITLDGPQAVHDSRRHRLGGQGTFAEIVRGIDLLLSLDIDVDLRVNLDAANLPALPELVDFLFEKGWVEREGFRLALAPVTQHGAVGCSSKSARVLSEMELAHGVLALMAEHPRVARTCHLGFLRHLDHLVSVLEPQKRAHSGTRAGRVGPRYWYCEASTDKQFVFTPEGLIYSCTEAVGKPEHAIGSYAPVLDLWQGQAEQWIGRTILSHPRCRACSISTLCGGGCNFAARVQSAGAAALIQISVNGRTPLPVPGKVEPFCNAAEETVRAYLRYIGYQRMSGID